VRWAQKKGALVARPSGGAEVVPARGALFRPESAGREGQRRLLLIIPGTANPDIHTGRRWLWIPALAAIAARPEWPGEGVEIKQHLFVSAARFPRVIPGRGQSPRARNPYPRPVVMDSGPRRYRGSAGM